MNAGLFMIKYWTWGLIKYPIFIVISSIYKVFISYY